LIPLTGIAGGITSGAAYFGMEAGSNVPPGMAAKTGEDLNRDATNTPAPAIALALRNCLLVTKARVFIFSPDFLPARFEAKLIP
jgi:hypothetical protein